MTNVMLLLVAIVTWTARNWGPIDPSVRAVPLGVWIFRTPQLDRKLDEWLGER